MNCSASTQDHPNCCLENVLKENKDGDREARAEPVTKLQVGHGGGLGQAIGSEVMRNVSS